MTEWVSLLVPLFLAAKARFSVLEKESEEDGSQMKNKIYFYLYFKFFFKNIYFIFFVIIIIIFFL